MFSGLSQIPWINFIGFQIFWWSCILFQNASFGFCALLISLHFVFHNRPKKELISVFLITLVGVLVDTVLTTLTVFQFQHPITPWLPPLWLMMLWLGFATTVTTTSHMFVNKAKTAAIIGGVFAPLSYVAGYRFGVVEFPLGMWTTWLTLVVIWSLLLPTLILAHNKMSNKVLGAHYASS